MTAVVVKTTEAAATSGGVGLTGVAGTENAGAAMDVETTGTIVGVEATTGTAVTVGPFGDLSQLTPTRRHGGGLSSRLCHFVG